jgi:hypothetical protein
MNDQMGGGGYVHPAVALFVVIAGVLMLVVRRKYVIVPFLTGTLLVPFDQVIVVGPLHFMMLRVMILFGWIRLFGTKCTSGGRLFSGGMNKIDKSVVILFSTSAITYLLLYQDMPAVVNELGTVYTLFGIYLLLRFLVRDEEDVDRIIRTLAWLSLVLGILMAAHLATGHDPFAIFRGGRPSYAPPSDGEIRLRATGPFAHALSAGAFGATLLPLFVGLWLKDRMNRRIAIVGILGATLITASSVSSTPELAYVAGILALCMWPMRGWMRVIRWATVICLVILHIVMKAPVWALIGKIDLTGSSSSYHRYMLVDQFIRHFDEWWLLGTKANSDWGYGMWDLADQYVAIGERSGLIPFIAFLAIIVFSFKYLGRARRSADYPRKQQLFLWSLSSALFAHAVGFIGIAYLDQTQVSWYALLAMISVMTAMRLPTAKAPEAANLKAWQTAPALELAPQPAASAQTMPYRRSRRDRSLGLSENASFPSQVWRTKAISWALNQNGWLSSRNLLIDQDSQRRHL